VIRFTAVGAVGVSAVSDRSVQLVILAFLSMPYLLAISWVPWMMIQERLDRGRRRRDARKREDGR
jgi:hypothetical protein